MNKILWATRRLALNIPSDALVLEVGSGGNPYPRSNVLLDAYMETQERHWAALVNDRPTVLSFGENLPFKDKVFDYVIAAHVLEHSPFPEKFLSELERVAKAGYIETPDAFMERINPYNDHRLEVTLRKNTLLIRKKNSWIIDNDLVELYEKYAKKVIAKKSIPQNPFEFHMRYFWSNKIDYKVINPEVDATWLPESADEVDKIRKQSFSKIVRSFIHKIIRYWLSQRSRNIHLNIIPLIRCPSCHSENISLHKKKLILCDGCKMEFKIQNNIFYMG